MLYELPDRLFGFLSVGLFNFPSGQLRCWLGLAHQSMRYSPLSPRWREVPQLFITPKEPFSAVLTLTCHISLEGESLIKIKGLCCALARGRRIKNPIPSSPLSRPSVYTRPPAAPRRPDDDKTTSHIKKRKKMDLAGSPRWVLPFSLSPFPLLLLPLRIHSPESPSKHF